jgi:hypothetical protein
MGPEKRSPGVVILLSVVTCGIYLYYWIYCVSKETKEFLGNDQINPGMEVLLSIVTCGIYFIYWFYKYGKLQAEMCERAQIAVTDNSIVYLILAIVGLSIISVAIMQSQLNTIWDNTYYKPQM